MKNYLLVLSFLISSSVLSFGQENCKVLKKEIAEEYTGECKNGLAHGKGIATGTDKYEGSFKKGFPNGKGIYTWANGEVYEGDWRKGLRHGLGIHYISPGVKETALEGKWANNKFLKNASTIKPYKITYKKNIGRLSCIRVGDADIIRLKLTNNGIPQTPSNITLQGTSGTEIVTMNTRGFKGVEFPFEGVVKFAAPNDFNSAIIRSEFRFVISQSGSWDINVSY